MISQDEAQKIARADAQKILGDLEQFKVVATLQFDGWHIDYLPVDPKGSGGAHYVIDEDKGKVTSTRYD